MLSFYVQSAGVAPEHDYHWKRVDSDRQAARVPELPWLTPFHRLVDSESASTLVGRHEQHLILWVTGMPSGRNDFRGRVIRNSVVVVADEHEEGLVRSAAARALRERLAAEMGPLVVHDENTGFSVRSLELLRSLFAQEALGRSAADLANRHARNSPPRRAELAAELDASGLPKGQGALVVVTGACAPARLARVWRGLTNLVPNAEWEVVEERRPFSRAPTMALLAAIVVLLVAVYLVR